MQRLLYLCIVEIVTHLLVQVCQDVRELLNVLSESTRGFVLHLLDDFFALNA